MLLLGIINIGLIMLLYGSIWFIPIGINFNRRKKGKSPYWMYLMAALVLEILLIYFVLFGAKVAGHEMAGLYLAPVIAGVSAGFFYAFMAAKLDGRRI